MENCRITIKEEDAAYWLAQNLFGYIGHETCRSKLSEYMNGSMSITQELLNDVNDDPDLLKKVIHGNETLVHIYDVETKPQSFQWKPPEEQRLKSSQKFGQISRFCSLFSSITIVWGIVSSCRPSGRVYKSFRSK